MSKRMRCFGVNHNAIEKKTNQLIVKFVSSIEVDGNLTGILTGIITVRRIIRYLGRYLT